MILTLLFVPLLCFTQDQNEERPNYCDELPVTYEKVAFPRGGSSRQALPRFATAPTTEYKVQVAILRFTDPKDFPFHPKLVARYRPCEEVWVVESRESFTDKNDAKKLQAEMEKLGYRGAYITELVAYHGG
ncbi:hypothetical protein CRP01_07975 [Flavilitoribacter nigricans DSM 23189 = NBRC 102662]|uniref:Uncharacterized protein n=1 Tax=Flavilitoribacter nigricans (strain ATCC 23147 / DSM 23189 / NBRC 102662 / NCIMB 1420 / SS-2) TaxID=1122177 RepID=A0A2D0NGE0_FLAN2|nr:hypothetical protein CRP01_07975 [Flavilitoribacter nigricans DSM 23189 = NBRC 102662]